MGSKSILLIDDNKAIRDSLIWVLEGEGYTVVIAENGKEALHLLHEEPTPSLILLDLMMPVMNGWEFRKKQKMDPRLSDIPTIIISALVNGVPQSQTYPNELVMPKPFDVDELLNLIKKFCG